MAIFDNIDLSLCDRGEMKCKKGHWFGPAIRENYLIHYILRGKGEYRVDGKTYYLNKGQGFLICPNVVTYYQADRYDPWEYVWVGFSGIKAKQFLKEANLDTKNLIFEYTKDKTLKHYMRQLSDIRNLNAGGEQKLLGYLYLFLGKLIEINTEFDADYNDRVRNSYIDDAIRYVKLNYWRKVTVEDIANHLSINRSYLYTLFKNKTSLSPQQFIIQFKMKKACELIDKTTLSISEIARSVGYEDPLIFSKIFKKTIDKSPTYYKKHGK